MHLAAESHVDRSIDAAASFIQTKYCWHPYHARCRA
jgi:dTDP-D-glucose 4,6-dehydratase